MRWNDLYALVLPDVLHEVLRKNLASPPAAVAEDGPFADAVIDHLAFALAEPDRLYQQFQALAAKPGVQIIDRPRTWPFGDGCPEVPLADRKLMATAALGGLQITLLAPNSDGDVIATYVQRAGGDALHHVAFQVPDIADASARLAALPGARQITTLAVDEEFLIQVFYKTDPDPRIIELVQRFNGFTGSFTCKNVETLTAGERLHSFRATRAV